MFLRRAIIGAVALVMAVACSRLLLGLHYPTDVIISATICPLISYAAWCVWNVYEKRNGDNVRILDGMSRRCHGEHGFLRKTSGQRKRD